jgi:restriction system protein
VNDPAFQYPPELLELLVETIPRLFRSKNSVLLFFQGAGVPSSMMADLTERVTKDRSNISKFEIARTILVRLNAKGDTMLRQRREVLRRIAEFDDFSAVWPGTELEAKGLVSQVRDLINVKDSFTRMSIERDRERLQRAEEQRERLEAVKKQREETETLRREFASLAVAVNPHQRGKQLETWLNRLFAHYGISVRESFALVGDRNEGIVEQIDGVIQIDGFLYLTEVKWWNQRLGVGEVSPHLVRVYGRGNVGGLVISSSGFTDAAIATCREALAQKVIVLSELQEIVLALELDRPLEDLFRTKIQAASIDRNPFHRS